VAIEVRRSADYSKDSSRRQLLPPGDNSQPGCGTRKWRALPFTQIRTVSAVLTQEIPMSMATRQPDVRSPAPALQSPRSPRERARYHQRTTPLLLKLVELDPREVDGIMTPNGFLAADVTPVGPMREACPHCEGVALQLVLRHHHVKRSHLFCRVCTRVYDALNESGHSVLTV
jgi:hypothetical protein